MRQRCCKRICTQHVLPISTEERAPLRNVTDKLFMGGKHVSWNQQLDSSYCPRVL
uniref:Uncharacterized protein n=1 Tax=Octopus bimaculoides TaxID=37653 RepID=A0A0L8H5N3_OCTBM